MLERFRGTEDRAFVSDQTHVGSQIAVYRIDGLIGRGGMSVVYLAHDLRLGRKVALKLLPAQLAEDKRFRDRFLRESRIAASIDHPNIVPIYDADEADGVLYIAMRYVEGTDLHHLIRERGPLGTTGVVRIITQVASALDAAHANGLVHRDVKPANVLLTANDHVYLSDFGLTKRALSVSGLTRTGELVGTIDYIAPEQIKGDVVDARADVYSLGCIVYECLTAQAPYPREMDVGVLWAHVEDPPPSVTAVRPDLNHEVDGVVERAMAKDPRVRTSSAGAVAAELRSAVGLRAPTPTAERAHTRTTVMPPRRIAVVAAFVAAVLALSVVVLRLGSGDRQASVVVSPDSVGRIDADTLEFDASVPVGKDPTGVVVAANSVWVINEADQTIERISAETGQELSTKSSLGTPTGIAWGEGSIWITNGFGNAEGVPQVVRIDPTDDRVQRAFDTPGGKGIAVAFGSVWVSDQNRDRVLRYDPRTGALDARIQLPEGSLPMGLSVGSGAATGIWVVNELGGTVSRIDPTTDDVAQTFQVPAPTSVGGNDEGVWVSSSANDAIVRFDPTSGTTIQTLSLTAGDGIPNAPGAVLVTPARIWVTSSVDPRVVWIDPATNSVGGSLRVRGIADALALDTTTGDVWVTVRSS